MARQKITIKMIYTSYVIMPEIVSAIFDLVPSLRLQYPEDLVREVINMDYNMTTQDVYEYAFNEWVDLFILATITSYDKDGDTKQFLQNVIILDRTIDCVWNRLTTLRMRLNAFDKLKIDLPLLHNELWKHYDNAEAFFIKFAGDNLGYIKQLQMERDIENINDLTATMELTE